MNRPDDLKILAAVEREIDLPVVFLFGSFVGGRIHEESDIDIAVLGKSAHEPFAFWETRERIASHLGYPVDLLDLATASPVIGVQILKYGRLLKNEDNSLLMKWTVQTLHAYIDLKMTRRPVEKALAKGVFSNGGVGYCASQDSHNSALPDAN